MNRRNFIGSSLLGGIALLFSEKKTLAKETKKDTEQCETSYGPLFPVNFVLQCKNFEILRYYSKQCEILDLKHMFITLSMGEILSRPIYLHADFECPKCDGDGNGECKHEGGSLKNLILLNPTWTGQSSETIFLIPDEELRRIVFL